LVDLSLDEESPDDPPTLLSRCFASPSPRSRNTMPAFADPLQDFRFGSVELEAVRARCAELEAAADQAEAEREMVSSARDGAVQRNAELERRLAELQAASARTTELAAAATPAEQEKAAREQARDEAASRIAELEERVVELEAAAAADDGHLAAATARVAELESSAARDSELEAELTAAREESARIQREKGAREAAHVSMAAHNADLEERLKQLEAANTRTAQHERQLEETAPQIARLEAERDNVSAVAHLPGQERRGHHRDQLTEDPSHLLFIAGSEGYRLVEQDGPPPAPGSTVELPRDDGTALKLTVTKVGASPLPGARVACAYLVESA
jgi:septal ring factor EnvC (AmiA/AmiB activator)